MKRDIDIELDMCDLYACQQSNEYLTGKERELVTKCLKVSKPIKEIMDHENNTLATDGYFGANDAMLTKGIRDDGSALNYALKYIFSQQHQLNGGLNDLYEYLQMLPKDVVCMLNFSMSKP